MQLCFGKPLDKSNQFSNWNNRPLREEQKIYAALDAYCLIEIYELIRGQFAGMKTKNPFMDFNELVHSFLLENKNKININKKNTQGSGNGSTPRPPMQSKHLQTPQTRPQFRQRDDNAPYKSF